MMRDRYVAAFFATALVSCVSNDEAIDPTACEGKCDDMSAMVEPPDVAVVRRLLADARRDGSVDDQEAVALAAFLKSASGRNERVAAMLLDVTGELPAGTRAGDRLRRALDGARLNDVPLENAVYRLVPGSSTFLEDDTLYLVSDGSVEGDTGLVSHSRGYAAKRDGVLFTRHGSLAPHHAATGTLDETAALRTHTPDVALDLAARTAGLQLSQFTTFSAIAHSPAYYDPSPNTPFWAGICQGWTHNSLDNRLSVLVDPPGQAGSRGVWIFGQWISRADLGNAMMGASYSLGIADSTTIDSFVSAESVRVAARTG